MTAAKRSSGRRGAPRRRRAPSAPPRGGLGQQAPDPAGRDPSRPRVDYGYLDRNPARGRPRRVKEQTRPASFLEADELVCVLDAAAAVDERARSGSSPRHDQIEALLAEGLH